MPLISMKLDGKTYEIATDAETFTAAELNAVELQTGMVAGEWAAKLLDRRVSTLAWTALAWIAKRRAGEPVKFHQVEAGLKVFELIGSVEPATPPAPAAETAAD